MNTINSRFVFENAKNIFAQYGFTVDDAKMTQSYLRLEVPMKANQNNYTFAVLENSSNGSAIGTYPTEQRIKLQDAMVASHMAIMVGKAASDQDSAWRPVTYPNKTIFSTAGAATSLYSLYNGKFIYNINNQDLTPAWDINRHLFIPRTQTGVIADGPVTGGVSANNYLEDSNDYSENGFYPVEPNFILSGAMNFNLQIKLANGMAVVEDFSRIVLVFRGVLAQNVTAVR